MPKNTTQVFIQTYRSHVAESSDTCRENHLYSFRGAVHLCCLMLSKEGKLELSCYLYRTDGQTERQTKNRKEDRTSEKNVFQRPQLILEKSPMFHAGRARVHRPFSLVRLFLSQPLPRPEAAHALINEAPSIHTITTSTIDIPVKNKPQKNRARAHVGSSPPSCGLCTNATTELRALPPSAVASSMPYR